MCVVSLALKMWTGPESFMCLLEYVGMVKKVGLEHDHANLQTVELIP